MKRRNFLKLLASSGVVSTLPLSIQQANANGLTDKFLVVVNMGGGWDPTSLCDPKGFNTDANGNMIDGPYIAKTSVNMGNINRAAIDKSKRIGGIQWSAIPETAATDSEGRLRIEQQYDDFFNTYGDRLITVNGINTQTNSHSVGNRHTWSGKKDPGFPGIAALHACAAAPNLPMSFITNGGYDYTAGLVPKSRANDVGYITNELVNPNYFKTSTDASGGIFYEDELGRDNEYADIQAAIGQRHTRLHDKAKNSGFRDQLGQLFSGDNTDSSLKLFGENLAAIDENGIPSEWNVGRNNGLKNQAKIAAAAFASGVAVSANLSMGGYDTHGNHDESHFSKMGDALEAVHYLNEALTFFGLADRAVIVVASDFGRTPWFNSKSGRDHWSITSSLILAPSGHSTGGKVFGETNELFKGVKVNPQTGRADESGIELTPAHVNKAIRKFVGIEQFANSIGFGLDVEDIQLFS